MFSFPRSARLQTSPSVLGTSRWYRLALTLVAGGFALQLGTLPAAAKTADSEVQILKTSGIIEAIAKHNDDGSPIEKGIVGINRLTKVQLPTLYSLYGAILADEVFPAKDFLNPRSDRIVDAFDQSFF